MAFLSKCGNILRQSVSKTIGSEVSPTKLSAFQALRRLCYYPPSTKVFVGSISYQTTEDTLNEAFSKYGQVIEARIITDRDTHRSKGYGFLTFASSEDASVAVQAMDGQELHGRRVRVTFAHERRAGFNGNGFGSGGYGLG